MVSLGFSGCRRLGGHLLQRAKRAPPKKFSEGHNFCPMPKRYRRSSSFKRAPKRRSTFKRRRVSTKRGAGGRRKAVSRKRSAGGFSGAAKSVVKHIPKPYKQPDVELVWMESVQTEANPVSQPTDDTPAYCNDVWAFAMNDIYTPTYTITGDVDTPYVTMPVVQGYTAQSLLYANWQVRHCSIDFKVTLNIPTLGGPGGVLASNFPPIDFVILPFSDALARQQSGLGTASVVWDALLLQPGCSKVHTLNAEYGTRPTIRLRYSMSPAKCDAIPGFFTQPVSWGTGTTAPVLQPCFFIYARHLEAFTNTTGMTFGYEISCKIRYAVRWFNRKSSPVTLAIPEAYLRDRKTGELGPNVHAKVQDSKEEKKVDDDGENGDVYDMAEDFKSLNALPVFVPPGSALGRTDTIVPGTGLTTSQPKSFTCLNPRHIGGHLQSSTCI
jgi:hypothetical protein